MVEVKFGKPKPLKKGWPTPGSMARLSGRAFVGLSTGDTLHVGPWALNAVKNFLFAKTNRAASVSLANWERPQNQKRKRFQPSDAGRHNKRIAIPAGT